MMSARCSYEGKAMEARYMGDPYCPRSRAGIRVRVRAGIRVRAS